MTSSETSPSEAVEGVVGPGARLRKQRELHGLDQTRVAAQLHLNEAMIEALEWDDFEALPGSVFTQGYLRNYARLLGVPEREILDAYHRICPRDGEECLNARQVVNLKKEVRSSHGLVRLVTWLIVIGLATLVFIWWQGRFAWDEGRNEPPVSETETFDARPESDRLAEIVSLPSEVEPAEAEYSPPQEVPPPAMNTIESHMDTLVKLESGAPDLAQEPLPEDSPVAPLAELREVQPETLAETATPMPETVPVVESGAETSAADKGLLVFEFNGRCWAEVRDATGKAHIIGEKSAGDRYELESFLGPFKVILGNVNGVRLTLDGEPYDLSPYTRGNVARFTLETGTQ
jgi:cytoskeleton protein RodZ